MAVKLLQYIFEKLLFVLGSNTLSIALGVVGTLLVLVLLVVISSFILCKVKGLKLRKQKVTDKFLS